MIGHKKLCLKIHIEEFCRFCVVLLVPAPSFTFIWEWVKTYYHVLGKNHPLSSYFSVPFGYCFDPQPFINQSSSRSEFSHAFTYSMNKNAMIETSKTMWKHVKTHQHSISIFKCFRCFHMFSHVFTKYWHGHYLYTHTDRCRKNSASQTNCKFSWDIVYIPWRIHGAGIYGNMDPINISPMLAYIPAPWIRHGIYINIYCRILPSDGPSSLLSRPLSTGKFAENDSRLGHRMVWITRMRA